MRLVGLIAGLLLAWPAHAQRRATPLLIPLDSTILRESATDYLGRLTGFHPGRNGRYYLADLSAATIREVDRSGRTLRRFGARGQGPGEMTRPNGLTILGDTLLVVLDATRLVAFRLHDGSPAWIRPLPRLSDNVGAHENSIFVATLNGQRRTSLALINRPGDSVRSGGPFPHPYGRHPPIDASFGLALRAAGGTGDTLVYAFHANEYLYFGPPSGPRFDSVRVGRLHRNGVPEGRVAAAARDLAVLQALAYALSAPMALATLSDGRIAYVAFDQRLLPGRLAGTLFVSIVDRRTRSTCPDARVPIVDDPLGHAAFLGDTLLIAHQDEAGGQAPRTIIRRFMISTRECQWVR